ncbi:MAG: ethanolamine utilization protein EutA [Gammaproteobacteria bacterium]|nr:MAG: ethanolamine utilization protein EutA [Pseudomonadota bacterium]PIE37946.1 MAG: ethanolamine utilization protein EutA [Gammaproteobacteria bacterium]
MNRKSVYSVGIDIGTTTTQVIFSRLIMVNRAPVTQVPRYEFVEREIFYKSPVRRTPLTSNDQVDVAQIEVFIDEQFTAANMTLDDIETGAVIITGETSKAENARDAVMGLAERLGDFVVATAGPNLESVIAGHGSGASDYAKQHRARVLNIDIGGGTSNYAIFDGDNIVDTACLNVAGHLIETDQRGGVTKIHAPAQKVIEELFGRQMSPAELTMDVLEKICERMAQLIVECIDGCRSQLCNDLLMTPALGAGRGFDSVFVSGGVGDLFYQLKEQNLDNFQWRDTGVLLARALLKNAKLAALAIKKPGQTLQATVIGAGAYTLSLSGSSIWLRCDQLPLRNVPVVRPVIDWQESNPDVCEQIVHAGQRMDLELRQELYAVAFDSNMPVSYRSVSYAARELAEYYHNHGNTQAPAIVITQNDLGKVLGMELQPLLDTQQLLVIDEVRVREGDFIDIGQSFFGGEVVPVTIKSLAFPA